MILADLGAEVLRVEDGGSKERDRGCHGMRNKRHMTLNLKNPEERDFLSVSREGRCSPGRVPPGVTERLRVDYSVCGGQ